MVLTEKGKEPPLGRDARKPKAAWFLLRGRFGVKHGNSRNFRKQES